MFGPSNHNGVPILAENFEECLSVFGVRKAIRVNWLNNKDEFYLPTTQTKRHKSLLRKAAVFALVDGGYASSIKIVYQGKKFDIRNQFCIASPLELRNWGATDVPQKASFAVGWLSKVKANCTKTELAALDVAKKLIKISFKNNLRAKGDPNRQLGRGDAGIRQLINGLFDFSEITLDQDTQHVFSEYQLAKERLRAEIEKEVYELGILMPFSEDTDEGDSVTQSERAGRA